MTYTWKEKEFKVQSELNYGKASVLGPTVERSNLSCIGVDSVLVYYELMRQTINEYKQTLLQSPADIGNLPVSAGVWPVI